MQTLVERLKATRINECGGSSSGCGGGGDRQISVSGGYSSEVREWDIDRYAENILRAYTKGNALSYLLVKLADADLNDKNFRRIKKADRRQRMEDIVALAQEIVKKFKLKG